MILKTKPREPKNSMVFKYLDVSHMNVGEIVSKLKELNIPLSKASLEGDYCHRDGMTIEIVYQDSSFTYLEMNEKMEAYKKKLAAYNRWYNKNYTAIEKEKENRRNKRIARKKELLERRVEAEKQRLKKWEKLNENRRR